MCSALLMFLYCFKVYDIVSSLCYIFMLMLFKLSWVLIWAFKVFFCVLSVFFIN